MERLISISYEGTFKFWGIMRDPWKKVIPPGYDNEEGLLDPEIQHKRAHFV